MKLNSIVASGGLLFSSIIASYAEDSQREKLVEVGKANFATCMACHGADGQGIKIGENMMAPSYTDSKIVNGDPKLLARILLKGIQKTDQKYMGMMAGLEALLATDEKLAGVMTYLRTDFGNESSIVTPEEAKELRSALAEEVAVTRAEIDAELAKETTPEVESAEPSTEDAAE